MTYPHPMDDTTGFEDDEPPMICPVTGQACMTEQNERSRLGKIWKLSGVDIYARLQRTLLRPLRWRR